MAKKFKHDWGFMANSSAGDLAQCQVDSCRMWRFGGGKPFKMSHEEYVKMHNSGEINATEVLGERKPYDCPRCGRENIPVGMCKSCIDRENL